MKCIDEIPTSELKGRRVLLRADFNLPIDDSGEVSNAFRAKQGWKTVQYLRDAGARVIILSHLSSNKRNPDGTIEPIARVLKKLGPVVFIDDLTGAAAKGAVHAMKDGELLLLQNVRRDPREELNDESFAKELASYGELFVMDAFAASHRAHASTVGVAKFLPSYAGLLVREEVQYIDSARTPQHPSCAILGGAKFETKAPLIALLLERYDHVFITGALANDVFKAKGFPVGTSLLSKEAPSAEVLNHPHFLAPVDVTVERPDGQARVKLPREVAADEKIVDIGPDSVALLGPVIEKAQFILWNGPTGIYEKGYTAYSNAIAELIHKRALEQVPVVIGGGDTIAVIEQSGVPQNEMGFLSTGGGAMLEYLLKGTLPAIEALN